MAQTTTPTAHATRTRISLAFIRRLGKKGGEGAIAAAELLRRAWDAVAPRPDLRAEVNATLFDSEMEFEPAVYSDAVEFMTATRCLARQSACGRAWTFIADGYRLGPAGP